jgi:hypothetical protein
LNKKSRVRGDFHARFCERLALKCAGLLDTVISMGYDSPLFREGKKQQYLYPS